MLLYHVTSLEAAKAIYPDGPFTSKEADGSVYFSDRLGEHASGYGNAYVAVWVPEYIAVLDDEFPDGEQHYRINLRDLLPRHIVGRGLVNSDEEEGN